MTLYEKELQSIKHSVYSNQGQIKTVVGMRNYIETNYSHSINLDLLSCHQCVSKYHLLRVFKKYYGQTPKQYLIDIRLKKSKEFLINGLSVTETCFAVGFESLGSFSTMFKTKTGICPLEFQKAQFSRSKEANEF